MNKSRILNVDDNSISFRDWLDKNNINYFRNGHHTSFDLDDVDIFNITKQYAIYEYLNKPIENAPIINIEDELNKWINAEMDYSRAKESEKNSLFWSTKVSILIALKERLKSLKQ